MAGDFKAQAFLADIFSKPVTIDGRQMSTREAYIRNVHSRALAGDINSHAELLKLRQACGVGENRKIGYLVVPDALPDAEWEKLAYQQQRPFREQSCHFDF